ncbi:hypothetical protein HWV62_23128 [Athelia sp. TMB]|nr:hypothetical protein HWV62_23128 [Athelia sp. TMB]
MAVGEYLATDDLTVLLGLVSITVFLLHNLYKPQALVHPILLGRQSDVGRVRKAGESAVYRNYATGLMGRLVERPDKDISVVGDLIKPEFDTPRTLWSTKITNPELKSRIAAFGSGLIKLAGLVPHDSNVLLLLNDGLEFLISDLALAAHSIPSFTLTAPALLSPVLETHPPTAIITAGAFLPHVLELIYDSRESEHHTVVVVGPYDANIAAKAGASIRVLRWADVEAEGARGELVVSAPPKPEDVYTVSFFAGDAGQVQGANLSHGNFTAGVAAARVLLPLSNGLSSLDTIVSAHSLSTAFGRTIAYTALYEGTSFATLASAQTFQVADGFVRHDIADLLSTSQHSIPSPTVLFIKPGHLQTLSTGILTEAKKSWLYSLANRHKLAGVKEGFISRDSLWDRMVLDPARGAVLRDGADTVRAVVVSGGALDAGLLTPARIALSVPLVSAHTHPAAAGPLFASHPVDLQIFPASSDSADPFEALAHTGPPACNVEAKLAGIADAAAEAGEDPVGLVMVRGPGVGAVMASGEASYIEVPGQRDEEAWVATGERGRVLANGAFKILPPSTMPARATATAKSVKPASKATTSKPKKAAAKTKPAGKSVAHPSWKDIISECIVLHKEDARIGVSRQTIKKYAADKYKLEMNATNTARLSTALTSGAEKGTFVFPKGPAGRVKLSPAGKAAKSDENITPPVKAATKPAKAAPAKPTKAAPAKAPKAAPAKKTTAKAPASKTKAAAATKKPAAKKPKTAAAKAAVAKVAAAKAASTKPKSAPRKAPTVRA